MTFAYGFAYDSRVACLSKQNLKILGMTFAYGWIAYGKPQIKPGARMTFAYDPPRMTPRIPSKKYFF